MLHGNHKMKKLLLNLSLSLLTLAPPLAHATLATTHIQGDGVYFMQQTASTYYGDANTYSSFWKCNEALGNCPRQVNSDAVLMASYSGGIRLDEPGSVYSAEMNLGFLGLVGTDIQSYPSASIHQGLGAVRFDLTATLSSLAQDPYGSPIPNDKTLSYQLQNRIPEFVVRDDEGQRSYRIASSFDAGMVPAGYSGYLSTRLYASIYDVILDDDGLLTFPYRTIIDETYLGNFVREFSLSRNLDDFLPTSTNEYAYYNILVESRLVFVPTHLIATTTVPEPATLLLCFLGIAGLAVFGRPSARPS